MFSFSLPVDRANHSYVLCSSFFTMKFDWVGTSESSPSVGSSGESVSVATGGGVSYVRALSTVSFGWMNPSLWAYVGV